MRLQQAMPRAVVVTAAVNNYFADEYKSKDALR